MIETYCNLPRNLLTFSTMPLTFGDVWYSITLLVDGKVASVAKNNCIGILAFSVVTNNAFTVFCPILILIVADSPGTSSPCMALPVWFGVDFRNPPLQIDPFFLNLRHGNFENFPCNWAALTEIPMTVVVGEPLVVLFIHIVLHHVILAAAKLFVDSIVRVVSEQSDWSVEAR